MRRTISFLVFVVILQSVLYATACTQSEAPDTSEKQTVSFAEMSNETCYNTLREWGFEFGDEIDSQTAEGNYDGVEYYRTMASTIEQFPGYVYYEMFVSFRPYYRDPSIAVINNLLYDKLDLIYMQNVRREDGTSGEIPVRLTVNEETGELIVTACDPADQALVMTPGGFVFVR